MALGERFRGTGSSGVADFLAEHQACDAGFDVTRDEGPGSGQLKIACKGCGKTVEYRAAEAAEMASGPPLDNGEAPPVRPAPSATPPPSPEPVSQAPGPVSPQEPPSGPRLRLPSRLANLLIAVVIVGGLGLIVAGLLRSDDDSDSPGSAASGDPAQEARPAEPEPTVPPEEPVAEAPPSESAAAPALRRRAFFDRFAIGVPRGWRASTPGGNLVLVAPGGAARVRVFSDSPATDPSRLAGPTADFLAEEHPGASVSKPERIRFGDGPAVQVRAVYEGGEEVAAVVSAGGFSFLVTYSQRDGVEDAVVAQGEASYASFRPR
jgi:hypothetical protein